MTPARKGERKIRKIIYAALSALVSGPAFGFAPDAATAGPAPRADVPASEGLGSVISSFKMSGLVKPYALGIYRDRGYVYGVMYSRETDHLYRFTPGGTRVSSYALNGTSTPRGADHAHLGLGYLALVDAVNRKLYVFRTTGGSAVTSFSVAGAPYPFNCFWDGTYYYANGPANRGTFYRHDRSGASAGTWTCSGWPDAMTYCGGAAFARRGNDAASPYLVAASWSAGEPMCMTTFPGGLLVATWTPPAHNANGLVYGDSSNKAAYGAAVWAGWYAADGVYAVEFDVGARGAAAAVPASLGRVKALYR